jgi:hypothetical protein
MGGRPVCFFQVMQAPDGKIHIASLNFGGIAGAHVPGIFVDRQRRKFGLPYAHYANGQMRGQVDAPEKKEGP